MRFGDVSDRQPLDTCRFEIQADVAFGIYDDSGTAAITAYQLARISEIVIIKTILYNA
jgi:hypothetical protein